MSESKRRIEARRFGVDPWQRWRWQAYESDSYTYSSGDGYAWTKRGALRNARRHFARRDRQRAKDKAWNAMVERTKVRVEL